MGNQHEFMMPSEAEELWLPDSQLPLKVEYLIEFGSESAKDIGEVASSAFETCTIDKNQIVLNSNYNCYFLVQISH